MDVADHVAGTFLGDAPVVVGVGHDRRRSRRAALRTRRPRWACDASGRRRPPSALDRPGVRREGKRHRRHGHPDRGTIGGRRQCRDRRSRGAHSRVADRWSIGRRDRARQPCRGELVRRRSSRTRPRAGAGCAGAVARHRSTRRCRCTYLQHSITTSRGGARSSCTSAPASTPHECACWAPTRWRPAATDSCGCSCLDRCPYSPVTGSCFASRDVTRPSAAARCSTSIRCCVPRGQHPTAPSSGSCESEGG